ncbi:protein Wiz isoform X2 [Engraulis encrasicolus]
MDHKCELCGLVFETRRGLSSHARCHLRQLGVSVSDSSGAPIELLYRLIEERDGALPRPPPRAKKQNDKPGGPIAYQGFKRNGQAQGTLNMKASNQVRKKYSLFSAHFNRKPPTPTAGAVPSATASMATASRQLTLSPLSAGVVKKIAISPSSSSSSAFALSPLGVKQPRPTREKAGGGAQDSDGPLNLATGDPSSRDNVHVCELCGAWFEARKGLSSHARAHLRSFGIESAEAKGAPIDTLHTFMASRGIKSLANAPAVKVKEEESATAISAKRPAPTSPSVKTAAYSSGVKRFKASDLKILDNYSRSGDSTPGGSVVCEFCGELFVRAQSLSSHARGHLRQLGITEWTVMGSPMATLRRVMAQRGVTSILKLPGTPQASPRNSSSSSSPLKIPPHSVGSLKVPSPLKTHTARASTSAAAVPQKARKGMRLVTKPKDEPMEVDVSEVIAAPYATLRTESGAASRSPLKIPKTEPVDPNQPVECTYCQEMFDSRKALSCHARAHLRQLGVRWPAQASPIDTLHQLMEREGTARSPDDKPEPVSPVRRQSASPVTFTPPQPPAAGGKASSDAFEYTCELCGFDFENRKALASHARAHLRQQGVEWPANVSPIETLSTWMQRHPAKVAELHKRYMRGDLPQVSRRKSSVNRSDSEATASDSEASLQKTSSFTTSSSSRSAGSSSSSSRSSGSKGDKNSQGAAEHTRSLRGGDRRSTKTAAENKAQEEKSKPSRSGNIPSLVPRPPESPLVKQVGKVYCLKCRFCEREFRGPLSVQEDWVRHLQEHILNLKKEQRQAAAAQSSSPPLLTPQPV